MVKNFRRLVCAYQILVFLMFGLQAAALAKLPDQDTHRGPGNWGSTSHDLAYGDGREGLDFENRIHNHPSVFIEMLKCGPTGYYMVQQVISAANYRGKRLKLSGFLKTQNVADWAALFMRVESEEESGFKVVGFDNMEDRPVSGTADWKEYSVVLDIPAKSTEILFGFMLAGTGKVWGGDLSLASVGQDITPTGKPSAALANLNPERKPVTGPQNLDFTLGKDGLDCWGLETRYETEGLGKSRYESNVDDNVRFKNHRSVVLRSEQPVQSGSAIQWNGFPVVATSKFRDKRIKFSAWLKTENVKERAGLAVQVINNSNVRFVDDDMNDRPITGTSGWKKYETVFDLPADAKSVRYGLSLHGGGEVWMSGLSVATVGNNVPLTVKPIPPRKQLKIEPPLEPLNLKFDEDKAPSREEK